MSSLLGLLADERRVLDALLYTHRNAHGRTQYYQRLASIRRCVRSLCDHHPCTPSHDSPPAADRRHDSETLRALGDRLEHLQLSVTLCDRLGADISVASRHLLMLVGQSYFMPFAVTMLAVCGRIRTVTQQMRVAFCRRFHTKYANLEAMLREEQHDSAMQDIRARLVPPNPIDPFDLGAKPNAEVIIERTPAQKRPRSPGPSNQQPLPSSSLSLLPNPTEKEDAGEVVARSSQLRDISSAPSAPDDWHDVGERIGRQFKQQPGGGSTLKRLHAHIETDPRGESPEKRKKNKKKKKKKKKDKKDKKTKKDKDKILGGSFFLKESGHDAIDDIFG